MLRNLTGDRGGRKGEKIVANREGGRHTIRDKYREQTGLMGGWGRGGNG